MENFFAKDQRNKLILYIFKTLFYIDWTSSNMAWVLQILRGKNQEKKEKNNSKSELSSLMFKKALKSASFVYWKWHSGRSYGSNCGDC